MSYMRYGWPLKYFKGETTEYIWSDGEKIEDYGSAYTDDASFCELMKTFIHRATGDEKYAEKMMFILADKLKVTDKLRKDKLSKAEMIKQMTENTKKFLKMMGEVKNGSDL